MPINLTTDTIYGVSLVPNGFTDPMPGRTVDLSGGLGDGFAIVGGEVINAGTTCAIALYESDDDVAWTSILDDLGNAITIPLTTVGLVTTIVQFTITKRYVRSNLDMVGFWEVSASCIVGRFKAANPTPADNDLPPREFIWSRQPSARTIRQRCPVLPGSGRSFRFTREDGAKATTGPFSFRVFRNHAWAVPLFEVTPVLDEATGIITVNPTVEQTALILPNVEYLGTLWRTGSDDNTDVMASILIWSSTTQ